MAFRLDSSEKVLVNHAISSNPNIYESVLKEMIIEAYSTKNLHSESKIVFKRLYKAPENNRPALFDECETTYKELWDCYRNLTGNENYDPHDKPLPSSIKRDFLVESFIQDYGDAVVGDFRYMDIKSAKFK